MSDYWTAADAAELDVLIFEFVRVHEIHVPRCETCRQGGPWCPRLLASFEAVLEWKQARTLRSKADFLRAWEAEAQTEAAPAEREFAATAGSSRWTRGY